MGRTPAKLKRNRNAADRYDSPAAHRAVGAEGTVPPASPLPLLSDQGVAQDALATLYIRNDGWLRMVPHDDGKTVYWKWKFTSGPWTGHYVMYLDNEFWPSQSLAGLVKKLRDVDTGHAKPVLDRWHQG